MIAQCGTLEISRGRLRHNLQLLRRRVGERMVLCATVKADAYGHGVKEMAGVLQEEGVKWVAVYSLEEAVALRWGVEGGVLALGPLVVRGEVQEEELMMRAMERGIRVNISDAETARAVGKFAEKMGRKLKVHVQVDAGLTRCGVAAAEAEKFLEILEKVKGLEMEGIFGHFSHADVAGHATMGEQLGVLRRVAEGVRRRHPGKKLMVHMQNSGGVWHSEGEGLDMVRVGIAMYGLQPSMKDRIEGLLPIARVVAPILAIHERPAGTGVGYGHLFVTKRASRLAVVPVGYAEGYGRAMTGKGIVQVRGMDVPVVGRVSMDQIVVDVTDSGGEIGEVVTVVSWDPARRNCVDHMAEEMGTIGYEVATHFGGRLKRVVVD